MFKRLGLDTLLYSLIHFGLFDLKFKEFGGKERTQGDLGLNRRVHQFFSYYLASCMSV